MSTPSLDNPASLPSKDLLSIADLAPEHIERVFAVADRGKRVPAAFSTALAGKSVVMLFEKPSLRTRVTFEVGVSRLGGHAVFYDHSAARIGARESIKDYAKNLERWVHAIVARTYEQSTIAELAKHAKITVINALSNTDHPCQALADLFTLRERFGSVKGLRIAYLGDANNVATSLAQGATKLGAHVTIISPKGFGPDAALLKQCAAFAKGAGGSITATSDPSAVKGHDAVYTDEWVSMHQTASADKLAAMKPYQVNAALMAKAGPRAVFMHCLPAVRGNEVTDEVIDSPNSLVYEQAENRLHVQNAVLVLTVGKGSTSGAATPHIAVRTPVPPSRVS